MDRDLRAVLSVALAVGVGLQLCTWYVVALSFVLFAALAVVGCEP
jgi:hypothetical protein